MSKKTKVQISASLTLAGLAWLISENYYRFFWQDYCEGGAYNEYQYLDIGTYNGVFFGGIGFGSDGVIIRSAFLPFAKDYSELKRATYERSTRELRLLSVDYISLDGDQVRQDVGRIDASCWGLLKRYIELHPEAGHIEIVDEKEPA